MASEHVAHPPDAAAKPQQREATTAVTGWRRWTPWLLIVLAAIIALAAALNVWVKRQALNTDNFTSASSQLLEDDDIRSALSVYIVNQLYENVDVSKAIEERLPPATKPLAPTVAAALQPALVRTTDTILGRPRIQQAFEAAVRRAHELFIAVLDGKHGVLVSTNGNVVLDLRPILEEVVNQTGIGERVLQQLPSDAGEITVMKGNQLDTARKSVKLIRAASYFLLFLVLALIAAAIYLARGRRRTMLFAAGASFVIVGLIVLLVHRLAGSYVVDALTNNPDAEKPVDAVWTIETELLRNVGINAIIYGILGILAAWIAGASRPATYLRRVGLHERPLLGFGAVAIALLILLVTGPTDGDRIYPLLIVGGVAFVGLEVLRRQTDRELEAAPAPSG
ncbi:MAG: hypothetical protein ACJ74I_10305 [Gaiellaceae bacterium]